MAAFLILSLAWGGVGETGEAAPKKGGTLNVGLNTDVTAVDPEGRGGHPIFPLMGDVLSELT